jgi:hypothetical protein
VEEAAAIEEAWRRIVDGPYGWSEHPIVRAAYEHPTLRALWPSSSHGTLSLYGTAWPPHPAPRPHRLAFVICGDPPFKVYRGLSFDHCVGAAGTVEEAVALLVATVPDPAGPDPAS